MATPRGCVRQERERRAVRCASWLLGSFLLCGLLCGCAGSHSPEWNEQPGADAEAARQAVLETHAELIRAYEAQNLDLFMELLDDEGDLLIFHPMVRNKFQDANSVRKGLRRMFRHSHHRRTQ